MTDYPYPYPTPANPTPPVGGRYGAPLGRRTRWAAGPFFGRVRARRVPLDKGGYDRGGAYWGLGAPVWYVYDTDGLDMFVRARTRTDAIAQATASRDWEPGPDTEGTDAPSS